MHPIAHVVAGACALALIIAAPICGAAPLPAKFDALAAPHFAASAPGATVVVLQAEQLLLRKAYGLANVELKVPMRADYVFRIGSISKTFTAVAVMQLVDRGKLLLEAPISRYLPSSPPSWSKITVEHLLVHASGIPDLEGAPSFATFQTQSRTLDEVIAYFRDEPLDFAPGSRTRYSSSGYIVLGKLIEAVSDQSYGQYLQDHIVRRLGLRHTALGSDTAIVPGMATGYQNAVKKPEYLSMTVPHAAGALISSADDLARFTLALHNGKLLSASSYERMVRPYRTSTGVQSAFASGLYLRHLHGKTMMGHNGAIEGYSTDVEYEADSKTVVVVLQNTMDDPDSARRLAKHLMALALGKPLQAPRAVAVDSKLLEALAGTYPSASGSRILRFQDGRLTQQHNGGPAKPVNMSSPTDGFIAGSDQRLRFQVSGGHATSLQAFDEGEPVGELISRVDPRHTVFSAMSRQAFRELEGDYQLTDRLILSIYQQDGRFYMQGTGQPPLEIVAQSPIRFAARDVLITIEFVRDSAAKFTQLTLHQGDQTVTALRK